MKEKKKKESGIKVESLKTNRRKFLGKLTLMGAGVMVYSSPTISAAGKLLSGGESISGRDRVIDVDLPATYDILASENRLNIKFKNGPEAKVKFKSKGRVTLEKTGRPNIAEVKVVFLDFKSVEREPFSQQGLKTGNIKATVNRNTRIGTLNLKTGRLREKAIPINISLEEHRASTSGKILPTTSEIKQNAAQAAKAKCTKKNDVEITGIPPVLPVIKETDVKQLLPASSSMGKLLFSFKPVNTPGRKVKVR